MIGLVLLSLALSPGPQKTETVRINWHTFERPSILVPKSPFLATFEESKEGKRRFGLHLPVADALKDVRGNYRLYFDFPERGGCFDTMLVFTAGISFSYEGGQLQSGKAALFHSYTHEKIEDVAVDRSKPLRIGFESLELMRRSVKPYLLMANFVNLSTPLPNPHMGVTEFDPITLWSDPSLRQYMSPLRIYKPRKGAGLR
jgi:hypothetical protein